MGCCCAKKAKKTERTNWNSRKPPEEQEIAFFQTSFLQEKLLYGLEPEQMGKHFLLILIDLNFEFSKNN